MARPEVLRRACRTCKTPRFLAVCPSRPTFLQGTARPSEYLRACHQEVRFYRPNWLLATDYWLLATGARRKILDQAHFVAGFVVLQLVDQAAREMDAKPPFADSQSFADHQMPDRIVRLGGVRQIARIEPGARVLDVQRDLLLIDLVVNRDNAVDLLAMAPFDGVPSQFAHRRGQLLDLRLGQARERKSEPSR